MWPLSALIGICALLLALSPFLPLTRGIRDASAADAIDTASLRNVDAQVDITLSGFRLNRRTRTYLGFATLTNISDEELPAPLYLVVASVSPEGTTVLGTMGLTTDGAPYYDLTPSFRAARSHPARPAIP